MPELNVRLFGAFRNLREEPILRVELPKDRWTVAGLRAHLGEEFRALPNATFDAAGLLAKAAIANEKAILLEDADLTEGETLALLPPVSGG